MKSKHSTKFRLYIFKSNKHIYANLIDQEKSRVITSISTVSREIRSKTKSLRNCTTAAMVGKSIGLRLKQLGVEEIIFDRGKNLYHGQVRAIADATRKEGIIF
uniref:Large ribosomal subunit protein uL18c n=1 Tax=Pleurostichidium falkenbergii TaxID=121064 RepID=A0A4D6UWY6_9FLOR|nr:ribosomal protein L18 [Pleurostichidium falkenbergii]QCH39709.1 ribosomal protein L18 [Pleurostichidium falkenbergii]